MARIGRSNKIATNSNGFVNGTIIAIEHVESNYNKQGQLEWAIGVETAKGTNSIVRFWTGLNINNEKNYYPTEGSDGEYNKLTQICLSLQVVNQELLNSEEDIDINISEVLDNKSVIFKMKPSERRRALKEIDIS